jgi:three-Cys-motif partner protein
MSAEHHRWKIGSPPPLIRPHSLAKHRVLEEYLGRYVEVLTSNPTMPNFRLTLVDGFSGGGLYLDSRTREEQLGSPMLMLRAMKDAAAKAQGRRKKKFNLDVEYFFVEKSKDALGYLKSCLAKSEFGSKLGESIHQLQGSFTDHSARIIERIKERKGGERAIFFLDQCGYAAVPLDAIRAILSGCVKAEVILTFAVDSLIDYMTDRAPTQKVLEKIDISLGNADIKTMKQRADSRWVIQTRLLEKIREGSGAKHFTPFFIRSKDAHRDYWLIHLSGHWRARDVMVDLHWSQNTSFVHYGRAGMAMLGYDPDEDPRISRQKFLPEFCFDNTARGATHQALAGELPAFLSQFKDGIPFEEFFARVTNETPATSAIMGEVLVDLAREGVIEIRHDKRITNRTKSLKRTDLLILSKQRRFFLPPSS